jgi:hypothetical protein
MVPFGLKNFCTSLICIFLGNDVSGFFHTILLPGRNTGSSNITTSVISVPVPHLPFFLSLECTLSHYRTTRNGIVDSVGTNLQTLYIYSFSPETTLHVFQLHDKKKNNFPYKDNNLTDTK